MLMIKIKNRRYINVNINTLINMHLMHRKALLDLNDKELHIWYIKLNAFYQNEKILYGFGNKKIANKVFDKLSFFLKDKNKIKFNLSYQERKHLIW